MKKLILCFVSASLSIFAHAQSINQVSEFNVSGDKEALVSFGVNGSQTPAMKLDGNVLELTFANSELGEQAKQQSELSSPHTLISRLSVYSPDKSTVRARVVIKGSSEGLKDRIHITREGDRVRVKIDFPKGLGTTAQLLEEEQLPLANLNPTSKALPETPGKWQFMLILLVFTIAGVSTFFFARFLSQRGKSSGTRKYLIEQLSYHAIGNKSGVALLKIGNEFALVGVTSQSITMLSALPKLQSQYEDDSKLEREDFKTAVNDEFKRISQSPSKLPSKATSKLFGAST